MELADVDRGCSQLWPSNVQPNPGYSVPFSAAALKNHAFSWLSPSASGKISVNALPFCDRYTAAVVMPAASSNQSSPVR